LLSQPAIDEVGLDLEHHLRRGQPVGQDGDRGGGVLPCLGQRAVLERPPDHAVAEAEGEQRLDRRRLDRDDALGRVGDLDREAAIVDRQRKTPRPVPTAPGLRALPRRE
jgi:hypothetical protein